MKARQLFIFLLFPTLFLSGFPLHSFPSSAKNRWTVDDVLLQENASQFDIAPDGTQVVWVKRQMNKRKGTAVSNLMLTSIADGKTIPLTRGNYNHRSPQWAPDGHVIAFLSDRPLPEEMKKGNPAKVQLWFINPRGGEPWPVTAFKRSPRRFQWVDASTIAFIAEEDPSLYEMNREKQKDTSIIVEDAEHKPPVRLYLFNVKDKSVRRVTTNDDWIETFAVSHNGRWAVTVHQVSLSWEYDQRIPPETYLVRMDTGERRQLYKGKRLIPRSIQWTPDDSGFYFTAPYSTDPRYLTATIDRLYFHDMKKDALYSVDLKWPNGLGFGRFKVIPGGFIALLADGNRFRPALYRYHNGRWTRSWLKGEHVKNIFGLEVSRDGRLVVYNHSTPTRPTQWYRAYLKKNTLTRPLAITQLNPSFKTKPMPRVEWIRFKGARGDDVDGILYYPLNYKKGKRYPLILLIHGGPTGVDLDAWSLSWARPIPLLVQEGAFVLRVNYHGSGNYGLEWAESIGHGKYYELEVPDLEAGIKTVIQRGLADPERLATMGWSNGAILSTELVTRDPRFKAASVGAGDVEWISDWANVDFGASFDNYYFGASPLENPMLYIKKSPFFRMKNVTTPTIIFTGTEDRNVPPSQSWSHYRALQQIGKTDVRFILFPGEPHGLRKYVHQRRKMEEELRWFRRYLFASEKPVNEALKEGSPLDRALKRQKAARVDHRYGVLIQKHLIPEVVPYRGLMIGRFEVTRAQYAAFDPDYSYPPGTDNYPVTGITLEKAKAYCRWLSRITGKHYRLPTESEAQKIYPKHPRDENTLDYWAGYSVNPDDAERLKKIIKGLKGPSPLIVEVGRFAPTGDDPVYDLGGNAAEWVLTRDGNGKLYGGSADRPADPRDHHMEAAPAYRGFRVLLEKRTSDETEKTRR